jgi:hypothetical protein
MTTLLDDFDLDIRIGELPAASATTPETETNTVCTSGSEVCDPFTQIGCPTQGSCHRTDCC